MTCETRAYQIVDRLDHLWIANRDTPLCKFPALDWQGFDFGGSISVLVHAPMEVTLDNISEDEHFPFIHTTFGCNEAGLSAASFEISIFDTYTEAAYEAPQRSSSWAPLGGVKAGDLFYNHWYTRFEPVHAVYTFGWLDRESGIERPIKTRAAVFLVPESAASTRIYMFIFLKIEVFPYRQLRGVMHFLARHIAAKELKRDAQLIESVADAPTTIQGMRLTRFDKALVANRKLLQNVYWGAKAHSVELPNAPKVTGARC